MEETKVKKLLSEVFNSIEESETIEDLEVVMADLTKEIHPKFILSDTKYPQIDFEISVEEIKELNLESDLTFPKNFSSTLKTPLEKLFYAVAWKQGDLMKYKHIIKGIIEATKDGSKQTQALTFYQFGKHLNDRENQPIIDQHVIRAFKIQNFKSVDSVEFSRIRKLNEITSKHKEDILKYKIWIIKRSNKFPEKSKVDAIFKIDRILMALGKAIKIS